MIKNKKQSTRKLLNLKTITDNSLCGFNGAETVFYIIQPLNLSVMSEEVIDSKIFNLTNILKGLANVDIMSLNSKDNFEKNKMFLKERLENEQNGVICKLLEKDLIHLDKIQMQTATARLFLLCVSLKEDDQKEMFSLLNRIEKLVKLQNFTFRQAKKNDIKNMLGVYLEQNVTTDTFEDIDGERWYKENEIIS